MKVGLITYHNAQNFGAFLQCLALSSYLSDMGYDVEIVDYRQKEIEKSYKIFRLDIFKTLNLKNKMHYLNGFFKTYRTKSTRSRIYEKMRRKYYNLSKPLYNIHDISKKYYDVIVIGSDQLWNTNYTKKYEEAYWGLFDKGNSKLVGYALSGNTKSLEEINENTLYKSIYNFDILTLRESFLADIIKERTGIYFPTVLDPTLLYHGDFWQSKMTDCPIIDGNPYILCYGVRKFTKDKSILKKKAEELNVSNKYRIIDLNSDNLYFQFTPFQFLSLINNAEYVITSSFHALVFSILFEKKFFSILYGDGDDSRACNLLQLLGLSKYGLMYNERINEFIKWDYKDVNVKLEELRVISASFLKF